MTEENPIEVRITPRFNQMWDDLGVDEKQRNAEIEDLRNSLQMLYQNTLDNLAVRCQEVRSQIQNIQQLHQRAMRAFGISENEILAQIPSIQATNLLHQLEESKQAYESFKITCAERVQKLENLVRIAKDLFDTLGTSVEDRGEFAELGDSDFSRERIERFRRKVEDLKILITKRQKLANDLVAKIKSIEKEMSYVETDEEQQLTNCNTFSSERIEKLEAFLKIVEEKKITRINQISQIAIEITHLWDLLKIEDKERTAFLSRHTTLSDDVLKSCTKEVERLCQMRNEKLPELIAAQREEIEVLWSKLHVAAESRIMINPNDQREGSQIQEFLFLEKEIVRLKKLAVELHTLLSSINEREDIIADYVSVSESTNDPQRLMSRGRGCAQQLMREEKARRRYKVVLPRLEKKLMKQLLDYNQKYGSDFEWDGVPYIEKLSPAPVETEPVKTKKRTKKPRPGETSTKCKTLPSSPRKRVQFANNENMNANQQTFSINSRNFLS